jgi:membrane protein implicated in regulation of membrane protease activity
VNVGPRGASTTVGLPGTGLSYRSSLGGGRSVENAVGQGGSGSAAGGFLGCAGVLVVLVGLLLLVAQAFAMGLAFAVAGVLLFAWAVAAIRTQREIERQRLAERRADLNMRFGAETATRILAGDIWLGQTEEQLRESLGDPVDLDEKVLKTKTKNVWKYDQVGVNRFKTRVTIENGVVTGWDRK